MRLQDAEQLARDMMAKWQCDGWAFKWSNAKRTLGYVKGRRCRITGEYLDAVLCLSKSFVLNNEYAEVLDTILHEIAHIKAGPLNGHNHVWRTWCVKVGARPQQYASTEHVTAKHTHELGCACCGRVFKRLFSKTRKDYSRRHCPGCGVDKSIGKIICKKVSE